MRYWSWKRTLVIVALVTVVVLIYLIVTDKPKPYVWGYYRGTYCATTSELEGVLNSLSTTPDPHLQPGQIDNSRCRIQEGELYSQEDSCPSTIRIFIEGNLSLTFCQKAIFEDIRTH